MIRRKLRIPMRDLAGLTGEDAEIAAQNRIGVPLDDFLPGARNR
jgi:hypothetical protein